MWASNDWTKVADVDGNVDTASGTDFDNYATPNAVYSSQWIVVAANNDNLKDAFKFKGFAGSIKPPDEPPSEVPVPGTLALLGLGALLVSRRLFQA